MGAVEAGGNLNLLLAAAVAGVQTDDDDSSSDGDHGRDPLTLDDAMELWNRLRRRQGQERDESFSGLDCRGRDKPFQVFLYDKLY